MDVAVNLVVRLLSEAKREEQLYADAEGGDYKRSRFRDEADGVCKLAYELGMAETPQKVHDAALKAMADARA